MQQRKDRNLFCEISEKILKESKNLQLYMGDITKNQLLKNRNHSANSALQEIDNTFGISSNNEKIFKLVAAKLDYNSLVKSKEKSRKLIT
ncbi:MAG: hypothetical protein ACO1N4_09890 [Pedobacter sp.]